MLRRGDILKNKNCRNIDKYIIALSIIIFSPVIASYLDSIIPDRSLVASKPLLPTSQPHSSQKSQTIFLNSILNEDFIPVITKESLLEKGNTVPFLWKFTDLRIREFDFFTVILGMIYLLCSISFISCAQMLISYIHKMDGKKDRDYRCGKIVCYTN